MTAEVGGNKFGCYEKDGVVGVEVVVVRAHCTVLEREICPDCSNYCPMRGSGQGRPVRRLPRVGLRLGGAVASRCHSHLSPLTDLSPSIDNNNLEPPLDLL